MLATTRVRGRSTLKASQIESKKIAGVETCTHLIPPGLDVVVHTVSARLIATNSAQKHLQGMYYGRSSVNSEVIWTIGALVPVVMVKCPLDLVNRVAKVA